MSKTRGTPLIGIRLGKSVQRRLRSHCAESGLNISDVVRQALELYFEYHDIPEYAPDAPDDQIRMEEKGDG